MSNTKIENLSEADHQRWHDLIDGINEVVARLWPEEEQRGPSIVIGAQFGPIGVAEDQPSCLVTANLPVCLLSSAISDMADFANAAHEDFHGQPLSGPGMVAEPVSLDNVPEQYRDTIMEAVSRMGIDPSTVHFVGIGDASDLDALETLFSESPSEESGESNEG